MLDEACTSETLESGGPQLGGARSALVIPDALHHELEVRRLDPRGRLDAFHCAEPAEGRLDLAGAYLVEDSLDELRLDCDRLAREVRVALDRAQDGGTCRPAVEPVKTKRVRKQAGNAPGEAVELRQGVLAQRDEDVDPCERSDDGGQRLS